jgi:hypothetical protein
MGIAGMLRDPVFWLLMALGLAAFALPTPARKLTWYWLLIKAVAEEAAFRYLLQDGLRGLKFFRQSLGPLSLANVTASLVFSVMHLISHSPGHAFAVFFPALVFGYAWDRYRLLAAPAALHFFYNLCLFYNDAFTSFI